MHRVSMEVEEKLEHGFQNNAVIFNAYAQRLARLQGAFSGQ